MAARALMVWGTSSGAGKSWLCTALCRWAAREGVNVAPFKAQNMSNNARVVAGPEGGWGEIGAAQYLQALAARVTPGVDMNPVLLKPERDTASQVLLHGQVQRALSHEPWRARSAALARAAHTSLQRLQQQHELLIIEGAGSPAEINLAPHDYVNLDTAAWADAKTLLVTDIDRGGAFAHLYGTWALLAADQRARLAGFVLNRFRGDAALLAPGPEQLQARTGVPTLAVLPLWRAHGLPEEDAVFDEGSAASTAHNTKPGERLRIAVLALPHISNLDEFEPLRQLPGVQLVWARNAAALRTAQLVILPGSKQVSGDLAWLRANGLDAAVLQHAGGGGALLGICGGLQMLGQRLQDAEGFDGEAGVDVQGLALLPLATHFEATKLVRRTALRFGASRGAWAALAGVHAAGYEIRNGRSRVLVDAGPDAAAAADAGADSGANAAAVLFDDSGQALGWQRGNVLGVSTHGLFECGAVQQVLFGAQVRPLDSVFDGLADHIDTHFASGTLRRLILGAS